MTQLEKNRTAFDTALATQMPMLHRLAFRLSGNREDAEDVVQDAMLLAYSRLEQFRGDAQITTWLGRIIINVARMRWRSQSGQIRISAEAEKFLFATLPDLAASAHDAMCERAQEQWLATAIDDLPILLRGPLRLRMLGYCDKEIAAAVGRKVNTVKAQLARGKAKILARKADA